MTVISNWRLENTKDEKIVQKSVSHQNMNILMFHLFSFIYIRANLGPFFVLFTAQLKYKLKKV